MEPSLLLGEAGDLGEKDTEMSEIN